MANHRGSTAASLPFVHAQIAPMRRVTAAARFDSIVKKLKKFATTVPT